MSLGKFLSLFKLEPSPNKNDRFPLKDQNCLLLLAAKISRKVRYFGKYGRRKFFLLQIESKKFGMAKVSFAVVKRISLR